MIQSLCTHFNQNQKSRHLSIEYSDCLLKFDDVFTKLVSDQEGEKESPKEFKFSQRDHQRQLRMDDRLIASACVLLASKFCEIDDNLVMIKEIQDFMKNYHCSLQKDTDKKQGQKQSPLTRFNYLKYEDIARAEIHVLERFEWDMFRIIPLDFFEIYILMLKKIGGAKHSMLSIVKKQGDIICEQTMVDHQKYLEFMPSDIALAAVIIAFEQFTESDECLTSKQECEYVLKQLFMHIFQLTEKSRAKYFQQNSHDLKSNLLNEQYSNLQSVLIVIIKLISGKDIEIEKLLPKQQTLLKNINLVQSTNKQSQNSSYIYTPSKNMNQESSSKRSIHNNELSNTITANKEFQPIKYSGVQPPIRLFAQSSSKKKQQNQSCQNSVQKNYTIKSPRESQGSIQKFSFNNSKLSQNFVFNNLQRKLEDINKIASSNNILKLAVQNITEQKENESNQNYDSLVSNSQYQTHRKSTKLQRYEDNVYMNLNNPKSSERNQNENIIKRNTFNDTDYYNRIKNPLHDIKKSIKTSDQFSDLQELSPLSDQAKELNSNYKSLNKINQDYQQDEKSKKLSGTRLTIEFSKKCQLKNQYYQKQNQSINYTKKNEKLKQLNLNNLNQYDSNEKNQPLYYKLNDKMFDHDNQYNQYILKKNRSQTADPKNNNISSNQQLAKQQTKEIDYDQLQKQLTEEVVQYEFKKQQSQDSPIPKTFQPPNQKYISIDAQKKDKMESQNENNIMHSYLKNKNEQYIRKTSEDNKNTFLFNYFLKNKDEEQVSQTMQSKEELKQEQKSQIKIGIPSLKLIKNGTEKQTENKLDVQIQNRLDLKKNLQKISSRKNSANPLKASQSIIKIEKQEQNKLRDQLLNKYIKQQSREQQNQSAFSSKRSQSQMENLNQQQITKQPQDKTSPILSQSQQIRFGQQIQRIQSDSQFQYFSTKPNVSQKNLQNDFFKKTDSVKPHEKIAKLKFPQQMSSINKKEQLTSRSTLKKLTSPPNKLQELNKNGNQTIKKTPRGQINISRNKQNINERNQNSISQNSMSKISQNSQQLLKLKYLNENRISQKNKTAKINTKKDASKALNINEEEDFSCSPLKYKRRNLSALFHSSTSSNQQNQANGQSKIEEILKLPITNELDDESFEKETNDINKFKKQQNPETIQQSKNNNIEQKGTLTRGSVTALKNTQVKIESRYPSAIGDTRLQNQDKKSSSELRVKSQLQYNTSSLKSPKESIDIFSQKLISILNEGKISVISDSIKEEEELNASVVSQKNLKIPPKIFSLGMNSVIQRLSQVKEEPDKPQTKKSHYLNILRDHISKQQMNKKYQNKIAEKQELSNEKLGTYQYKQDSNIKQSNAALLSSQQSKKILPKEKVENCEQTQKIQNKHVSMIDELIQSKQNSKQDSMKTLQHESSYGKLKQSLEKQRFSSNQKNNLSIICEDSKVKLPEQTNQIINSKSNIHHEKIEEHQKVLANNKVRQAVITPKQTGVLASGKIVSSESQQLSAKNKFVQRKYNMQVHYLQPNKVFQKIYGHNYQDQKDDDKSAKQNNQVQKKQNKQDEVTDQKERQKTPLINEIESQAIKPVKKSEQSSIMSQISSTSNTNKIIKPSLKYNNPFKNQGSIIQHKKQQHLHITNQQQGDSYNLVQNDQVNTKVLDSINTFDEGVQIKEIDLLDQNVNESLLNFEKRFETLENSKITYKNQTSRITKKNKMDKSNSKLRESHSHQQIDELFKNTIVSSDLTEANQIQDQEIKEKQSSKQKEQVQKSNFYMKKSNSITNYEFQSYFLNKQRRSIEIPNDKKLIKSKWDYENSKQQESIQSNRKVNRNSIQTDTHNQKLGLHKKLYDYKSDLQKFQSSQNKISDTANDKLKIPKAYQKRNQSNQRLFDSKQLSYTQKFSSEFTIINDGASLKKKDFKTVENKKTGEKQNAQNMKSQTIMIIDSQEDEENNMNQIKDHLNKQFNQQDLMMIKDEEDLNLLDADFKNLKKRRSALERKINKTYKVYDK